MHGLPFNATDLTRLPHVYQEFYRECSRFLPSERIYADPLRTFAFGTDASVYRLIPKLVIKVYSAEEMKEILRLAGRLAVSVTFRAAGTSLSGQAVSDSVLLVLAGGWRGHAVAADGATISLEPGVIGAEANDLLRPYGRKIGPDPASIHHAMIGGIAANNASGMCCGTADNSYQTIVGAKLILADGAQLDTADPASRQAFAADHQSLLAELTAIRDELRDDAGLADLVRRKYRIKNTTGYSLNAFVDFFDPLDILEHLMVGSEGTLGFVAEISYRTVVDHPHKASALLVFPDLEAACRAVHQLDRELVAAAELMDRIALRSVEEQPGMPAGLKKLAEGAAALLVEVRGETLETLQGRVTRVEDLLAGLPRVLPGDFTAVPAEYEALWKIRKGLFPAVGNVRASGTSVIIEDIAFPRERLAEATRELRGVMERHGYGEAIIFGHALDGNLHFVLTQDFARGEEIRRYDAFMREVCDMVAGRYCGSLKAEHGTGRNMAPFVEQEWGAQAYRLMVRIKAAFDPKGILNPGVILNTSPTAHLDHLKPMPAAHEDLEKCIECGFCEVMCPSKNLSSTPRQRIVARREIARLEASGGEQEQARLRRLAADYGWWGNRTCAADGLCATTCPVDINTGTYTKKLRAAELEPASLAIAGFLARHFAATTVLARNLFAGLHGMHLLLGSRVLGALAGGARRLSGNRFPHWDPWQPRGGKTPRAADAPRAPGEPRVVYFPGCVSRVMGTARDDPDPRPLARAVLSVLEKAGCEMILPSGLEELCCGMAFESKGFFQAAETKSLELETALLECSRDGSYPVLCDTSPCLLRMREVLDPRLRLYEPVEFIHDRLLKRLKFRQMPETVALHVTCSSRKMQLDTKFRALAEACAQRVVVPESVRCCGFAGNKGFDTPELTASALAGLRGNLPAECVRGFSNSRPCEIGLSRHSGISYQSIVYLVDRCTEPRSEV